jgi:hypothetical protein
MSNAMHIADSFTAWLHDRNLLTGWALCGARLTPKNGAPIGAPICPECQRKSGKQ